MNGGKENTWTAGCATTSEYSEGLILRSVCSFARANIFCLRRVLSVRERASASRIGFEVLLHSCHFVSHSIAVKPFFLC